MTSITLAGRLELQSTNGDGALLLSEAAQFVNALAQMGVQLGVRVALAPVEAAPSAYQRVANELPILDPVTPVPAAVAAQRPYNKDDGRTFETVPPVAPAEVVEPPIEVEDEEEGAEANPQPAAPAQPDEPHGNSSSGVDGLLAGLDAGRTNYRALPRATHYELEVGRRRGTVSEQATRWVRTQSESKHSARLLLFAIASRTQGPDWRAPVTVSVAELMADTRLDKSQIWRALKQLEALEELEVGRKRGPGARLKLRCAPKMTK